MKTFLIVSSLVVLLASCAVNKTTTVRTVDENNNVVETVTEEPLQSAGFFESGNLAKYYDSEDRRVERYNTLAKEKINFVKEQGAKRQVDLVTSTERALSNILDTLLVTQISTAPPPASSPPPKTMVDSFDKNLVPIANLVLQAYGLGIFGDVDRPKSDSSVSIVNSGLGDVFFQSDYNKNPIYKVAEGGVGTWDLGLDRGGDLTQIDRSNDSSSNTLW